MHGVAVREMLTYIWMRRLRLVLVQAGPAASSGTHSAFE